MKFYNKAVAVIKAGAPLAKVVSLSFREKIIRIKNLAKSKLICVLPAGGCDQMLQLHHDMITYNTLGVGKRIISIYDGDVKQRISKKD